MAAVRCFRRKKHVYHVVNENYFALCKLWLCVTTDGAPPDGTPQNAIQTVNLWLVVVYYFLVLMGIVFIMVCLVFNIVFRNRRLVVSIIQHCV